MKFVRSSGPLMLVALTVGAIEIPNVMAACPCKKGGQVAADYVYNPIPEGSNIGIVDESGFVSPPATGIPAHGAPINGTFGNGAVSQGIPTHSVPSGAMVPATGVPGVGPGYSSATSTSWQPPPGSIGRTYQMKSRPVPVTMHPRSAIVDVRVKDAADVRVHEMNVNRTKDYLEGFHDHTDGTMWHFTADPLIPGLPHIYRIEARFEGPDGKEVIEERYVRLIMGRVIEIEIERTGVSSASVKS
ncbi:MAG TPA: hypothetical protein VNQ76_03225 [Planctomicrobium sp.]|nr:hypothetical protein [Planctomicrobium sp.]